MHQVYRSTLKFTIVCLSGFFLVNSTQAQTIPDNSLGAESSLVTPTDETIDLIEGGAIRDNNLFHSFSDFNVGDGNGVYFASPNGVANIMTRVTGNNPSQIFGTLGVNGAANLFLLNPNGIIFGENAALDVSGSFLATTADSYIFENDFNYSASNPEAPSLLTVNIPVGLQFGDRATAIEVAGTGHSYDPLTATSQTLPDNFLAISSNNTFALIAGEINFTGGNVVTSGGNVELASIATNQRVDIVPNEAGFTLESKANGNFGKINLTRSASINASGEGGGRIKIRSNDVSLAESAFMFSDTLGFKDGKAIDIETNNLNIAEGGQISSRVVGNANGGNISIEAQNIQLDGTNFLETIPSAIATGSSTEAVGKSGNITIKTSTLGLSNNAKVFSRSFGTGNAGDVSVKAEQITIEGSDSRIETSIQTDAMGNSGRIDLTTANLSLSDSARVFSASLGQGNGGDISIEAGDIFVDDSFIYSGVERTGVGNAGNIHIETANLGLVNAGQINSASYGQGNAGNILIEAQDINFDDSGIYSFVDTEVVGNSGNIEINTTNLNMIEISQITSTNYGQGDGGDILIEAQNINFDNSRLYSDIEEAGIGNSGDIDINTQNLNASDTLIFSGVLGQGDGGDINIQAQHVELKRAESEFARGLYSSVQATGIGTSGDINIDTASLRLLDGAQIDTGSVGRGNGGTLTIDAEQIELIGFFDRLSSGIYSSIEPEAFGNGGDIILNTQSLRLIDGGEIKSSTDGAGNAGDIIINASEIEIKGFSAFDNQQSTISAFAMGTNSNAGSIAITSNTIDVSDRGNISVSNLGSGNSGNIDLTASQLNLNRSATIEAKVDTGSQGNIRLNTNNIFLNHRSEITATALGTAQGGNIAIDNAESLVLQQNSQIIANAIEGDGGSIEIETQGYFVSADSLVSASSEFGLDGNIELETLNSDRPIDSIELPSSTIRANQQITSGCNANSDFALVGKGGLPDNPTQNLRGQATWQDLRLFNFNSLTKTTSAMPQTQNIKITEAQRWQVNSKGKIELIADSNINHNSFFQRDRYCS